MPSHPSPPSPGPVTAWACRKSANMGTNSEGRLPHLKFCYDATLLTPTRTPSARAPGGPWSGRPSWRRNVNRAN
eukprot:scaffold1379_cov390-Prasinococcus_capsulatus_cf.AAC.10